MPGYDGTGPQGTGPNGRGMGPCGQGQGRVQSRWNFFGFRRGWRGRGRGFRWFSRSPLTEKEDLDAEKRWLTEQLEIVNQRMDEINKKD